MKRFYSHQGSLTHTGKSRRKIVNDAITIFQNVEKKLNDVEPDLLKNLRGHETSSKERKQPQDLRKKNLETVSQFLLLKPDLSKEIAKILPQIDHN